MIHTGRLSVQMAGEMQVIDITNDVVRELKASKLRDGTVTVFVTGSTAAITVFECEDGLVQDLTEFWNRLVPRNIEYKHNRIDDNGHAHIKASLPGPSVVVPFCDGQMSLGKWQQILLVDFDTHPRQREIILQFMGE